MQPYGLFRLWGSESSCSRQVGVSSGYCSFSIWGALQWALLQMVIDSRGLILHLAPKCSSRWIWSVSGISSPCPCSCINVKMTLKETPIHLSEFRGLSEGWRHRFRNIRRGILLEKGINALSLASDMHLLLIWPPYVTPCMMKQWISIHR